MYNKVSNGISLIIIIEIMIFLFGFTGWAMSINKLINSDFEKPYKREIVYAIGTVIPPSSIVIGWLNIEDGKK